MSGLFRKKAVENYREQFSTDGNISKPSISLLMISWIFILGVLLTAVWFFFGNIVSTTEITGVVYPTAGIEKITATKSGMISNINVNTGDTVKTGDIVAVVPDDETLEEISQAEKNNADETEIENLRQKYANNSIIHTKSAGTILNVANEGAYVAPGEAVVTIAAMNEGDNLRQILAFLPTSQKNNISLGCQVQVSPNYAPREKYGYINGYISEIDTSVITKSDAQNTMDVYNIPNMLDNEQTYISVYINLLSDDKTESGLKWSVNQSGAIDVKMGDMCEISVVESSLPPYKWLFGGV